MKLSIPRREWQDSIAMVAPVAPAKPSQRALSFIRIDADDTIAIRATDLMTFARVVSPGEIMKPGSCLVEAKTLVSIARVIPDSAAFVTLEIVANNKLRIVGGGMKHEVATLATEEFPEWPRAIETMAVVHGAELLRAIHSVEHAAASDETKPWLSCLKTVADGKSLLLVASDGHRLATTTMPFTSASFDVLIPIKGVATIARALDAAGDGEVQIGATENGSHVGIRTATHDIVMRVVEERFPPWERLVPEKSKNRATILRDRAIAACRNVEVAARKKIKDMGSVAQIAMRMDDGAIRFSGENTDGLSADCEVDCDYAGANQLVGMNAGYLLDTLCAMTATEVVFDIKDPEAPMRIEPVSDDPFFAIVMPMRFT